MSRGTRPAVAAAPIGSVDMSMSTVPASAKRDDERRAHQEVRADVLVHARLEVAVAATARSRDEVVLVIASSIADRAAGVADAGRAAVADESGSRAGRGSLQPGFVEILGDDARARRERRLHRGWT
jgi:hypothetical protein